jgi:hypothetical protein
MELRRQDNSKSAKECYAEELTKLIEAQEMRFEDDVRNVLRVDGHGSAVHFVDQTNNPIKSNPCGGELVSNTTKIRLINAGSAPNRLIHPTLQTDEQQPSCHTAPNPIEFHLSISSAARVSAESGSLPPPRHSSPLGL